MNGTERSLDHLSAIEDLHTADVAAIRARAADAHAALAENGMRLNELSSPPAPAVHAYAAPADEWSVDDLPLGGFPEESPSAVVAAPPAAVEIDDFVTDDDGIPIWQD